MDTKTGQIYTPEELTKDPPKSLKDLEPLTREEAAFLSDVDPTERVAALARRRELDAMNADDIAESLGVETRSDE